MLVLSGALALSAWLPGPAHASDAPPWAFDPQAVLQHSRVVIERAPDADLEQLFQAVVLAANEPTELQAMCSVFAPRARRDLAAINRIAHQLGPASQRRFQRATDALLNVAPNAPRQPYDPALAQRSLRQAAVVASMLFDGFLAGINTRASDPASQQARCRSLQQLLSTVGMRPPSERAMIMRLLMREGVRRVEAGRSAAPAVPQDRDE